MASAGDTLEVMLELGGGSADPVPPPADARSAPAGGAEGGEEAARPGRGEAEPEGEELEALQAVVRDFIAWLLGAILGRWNPPKLAEVPGLLKKYQRSEVLLLRTALFKYVARSNVPDASGFPPASAAHPHAPWNEQQAEYRRLLRALSGAFQGRAAWQEPVWPKGACSEWLVDSFFQQAWVLLEHHIADLRAAASHGGKPLLPRRDLAAAARAGAGAFAAVLAEPSAVGGLRAMGPQELRAAWGLKYRRLFMAASPDLGQPPGPPTAAAGVSAVDTGAVRTLPIAEGVVDRGCPTAAFPATAGAMRLRGVLPRKRPANLVDVVRWLQGFE